MLSGETAIGDDPVATVARWTASCDGPEEYFDYHGWGAGLGVQQIGVGTRSTRVTAAITGAPGARRWKNRRSRSSRARVPV